MTALALLVLGLVAVVTFAWRRLHRQHGHVRTPEAEAPRAPAEAAARESITVASATPPAPAPAPATTRLPPGWSVPQPAHPPRPMYWPALLALGLVWSGWGAISSPILIFAGLAVSIVALTMWIREMLHAN